MIIYNLKNKNNKQMDKSMDKSIKVLFVGDPHFKVKNTEYIPLFTSRILNIVETNELDFIVIAGDLLDNHDRVDIEPLNLATQFIDSLRQKVLTFVLVGNHDYKNNQQFLSDHHWMNALKKWNNVTIVDDITKCNIEDHKFLFVPYVPPGRFVEAIETRISMKDISDFKAIFAHQEFYGCKMGPIESKYGDKWDTQWPLVVSGHIHNKQWSQNNIYYPGSAMQHAFGQSTGNTVSILTFSPSGRPNTELSYEEVDLCMPKLTIKYLSMKEVMQPLKFKNREFRKYKIVLQGTHEEFKTFKKNARYKELLEQGFKITFKVDVNMLVCREDDEKRKTFLDILNEKICGENDSELECIYRTFVK